MCKCVNKLYPPGMYADFFCEKGPYFSLQGRNRDIVYIHVFYKIFIYLAKAMHSIKIV